MLTDEEIQEIRNHAKLNDNRQIDPMAFARAIERAVLAKAGEQEPKPVATTLIKDASGDDPELVSFSMDDWVALSKLPNGTKLYAHPLPAQAQAIPEGVVSAINSLDRSSEYRALKNTKGEGGFICGNIRPDDLVTCVEFCRSLSASPKP